ncbi:MAG: pyridoxal-phosphate dependent enzyme, partial [Woeseiaceae bacterium]|nr:pyridoxal-phosphate dependent enzyme [Woeseiaceae bacterium]
MSVDAPHIDAIRKLREQLGDDIVRTPLLQCTGIEDELDNGTRVFGKLEFLQRTGTFKARGALSVVSQLTAAHRAQGVTAVSAGNHAIAVAYAAKTFGVHAKLVMISTANPLRVAACRALGAEVIMAGDAHTAFARVEAIRDEEGRFFVHPFEGPGIAAGTGTLGLEVCEQCEDFDVMLVPVGGGGLIAGVANAVRQLRPQCRVIGIEPFGADSMYRSFESGKPEAVDSVQTIADSLGA